MTRIITGVYNDQATGQAAAEALRQRGFGADAVRIDSGAQEGLEAALQRHGISSSDAASFAGVARNGGAVVSARAEFGEAGRATQVLESFTPAELRSTSASDFTGNGHAVTASARAATATPASIADNPAPLSSSLGIPILSQSDKPSSALLSDNPAPFSAMLHLPVLTRSDLGRVNLPSDNAAPFSDALKLPTLSHNAAPFSSLFKLPLLSRDPHPAPAE